MQAGQAHLIYVTQFARLNEFHEEPERESRRAVHEQLADQEVHALHVVRLIIVTRESAQHRAQFLDSWLTRLEEFIFGERA